jgi:phytanoyl-CoA hydroxylase
MDSSEQALELHSLNRGFVWHPAKPPFRRITEEQGRSFNQLGYFVIENALDPATVERAIGEIDPWESKVERYLREQPDRRHFIAEADGISFTTHLVKRSQFLRELSAAPIFTDLCRDLIGPDVRLYNDQAVYKKPEYPKHFPWHQDNGYNFVEPQTYLTCWVALTDATVENGCPWILLGGHLRGTLKHHLTELGWACREDDVPEEAAPAPLRAGGMVVFSSLTPHRTGPNLTDAVRKAYILQYASDGSCKVEHNDHCDDLARQYFVVRDGERVPPPVNPGNRPSTRH